MFSVSWCVIIRKKLSLRGFFFIKANVGYFGRTLCAVQCLEFVQCTSVYSYFAHDIGCSFGAPMTYSIQSSVCIMEHIFQMV